jgi:hypothetical protein
MRPSWHDRVLRRATSKLGALWRAASGPWVAMLPGTCGVPSAWDLEDPRRGPDALPGQPRGAGDGLHRC